jgi:hypothetical protein
LVEADGNWPTSADAVRVKLIAAASAARANLVEFMVILLNLIGVV